MVINLDVQNRNAEIEVPQGVKWIKLSVSRPSCMDVLLEVVDINGLAKGKPLQKWLSEIKSKTVSKLRFMMNNNSTKPITISIDFK
ncbi:hypothetical protein [Carboxylicivirga sp. N1Y90]|uniref:hypothetical protein n=1 Tax=Carboxylicivirga fragile TaxID=3417571 RepID=UPI003D359385|nr:hypothetical protein [Marinilabiliaceae bacterium N1Y90]